MARDTYVEVTRQSWFSRLGGAFKGILVGGVLVLAAFGLLFWNEGRAVERHRTLEEGGGVVVSVGADRVDPAHEGRLVHLSAMATTDELLTDDEFGVEAPAIRLERRVEMYQWRESEESETRTKVGGGTETVTTYSYSPAWSPHLVDSSGFKRPAGHENPRAMPYAARTIAAETVSLGAFRLSPSLISKIGGSRPLPVESLDRLPAELRSRAHLHEGGLYLGRYPRSPEVGDLRVSFAVVEPAVVSVVARQVGGSFDPYPTRAGGTIELLRTGAASAAEMFAAAQQANRVLTWILRGLGLLVMTVGFRMVFRPLAVLADVLPVLGRLVQTGAGLFAFLLAGLLSLVTVAIAWLVHRPLLGVALLAAAAGTVLGIVWMVQRARHGAGAAAAGPPPPGPAAAPPPPPPPPLS